MSGLLKSFFQAPFKHKKLSEDWAQLQTSVGEGVTFACRDLGSTMVTEAQNETATAEAVRRVIHLVRASRAKPKRVALHVSSSGVRIRSAETGEIIKETDIYDIAYCSADSHFSHVVAFIANGDKNAFECYAYLCQSSKMAQTVSISIAHAFNMVYNGTIKTGFENRENKTIQEETSKDTNSLVRVEQPESLQSESKGKISTSTSNETVSPKSQKSFSCESMDFGLRELDPLYESAGKSITFPPSVSPRINRKKDLNNWAAFDEEPDKEFAEAFSILRLNADPTVSPFYTKPPQRCKDPQRSKDPQSCKEPPTLQATLADASSSIWTDAMRSQIDAFQKSNNILPSTGNIPPSTGNIPPSTGNIPPSTGNIPPSTGNIPPSTGNIPPSTGNIPPSTGNIPPSTGNIPSCAGNIPPSKGNIPPFTGDAPRDKRISFKDQINSQRDNKHFFAQTKSFDEFETVWGKIGVSLDRGGPLGNISPLDEPLSLGAGPSQSPFNSHGSNQWTCFSD